MPSRSDSLYIDLGQAGEVMADVDFEFQPAERMTRDYPGCAASVEVNSVMWNGIDWWPRFTERYRITIEDELLERQRLENK